MKSALFIRLSLLGLLGISARGLAQEATCTPEKLQKILYQRDAIDLCMRGDMKLCQLLAGLPTPDVPQTIVSATGNLALGFATDKIQEYLHQKVVNLLKEKEGIVQRLAEQSYRETLAKPGTKGPPLEFDKLPIAEQKVYLGNANKLANYLISHAGDITLRRKPLPEGLGHIPDLTETLARIKESSVIPKSKLLVSGLLNFADREAYLNIIGLVGKASNIWAYGTIGYDLYYNFDPYVHFGQSIAMAATDGKIKPYIANACDFPSHNPKETPKHVCGCQKNLQQELLLDQSLPNCKLYENFNGSCKGTNDSSQQGNLFINWVMGNEVELLKGLKRPDLNSALKECPDICAHWAGVTERIRKSLERIRGAMPVEEKSLSCGTKENPGVIYAKLKNNNLTAAHDLDRIYEITLDRANPQAPLIQSIAIQKQSSVCESGHGNAKQQWVGDPIIKFEYENGQMGNRVFFNKKTTSSCGIGDYETELTPYSIDDLRLPVTGKLLSRYMSHCDPGILQFGCELQERAENIVFNHGDLYSGDGHGAETALSFHLDDISFSLAALKQCMARTPITGVPASSVPVSSSTHAAAVRSVR